MYKIRIDNFDLEQVAKSGQCFRWIKNGENTYNIAAFGREVDMEGLSGYRHRLWKDSKADRRRG